MKQQVFYLHGGESYLTYDAFVQRLRTKDIWDLPGAPYQKKWTGTLAEDLGEGYEVFTPKMPNPNNAKYDEWKIWFERHFEYLRGDVILIGCSLGAMFWYRYFTESDVPFKIKALILMASPATDADFTDADCGDFVFDMTKVGELTKKTDQIHIMHSEDDFLVPFEHALKLQAALPTATLHRFTDKNHFLVEELPELIDVIKKLS